MSGPGLLNRLQPLVPPLVQALLPRSLLGRLMAVLVLGLVAAQGLSLWINLAERDRLMLRAAGLQPAQRVADLVLLLDPLNPAERQRIVRVLDAPPLRVSLETQADTLPPPPSELLARHPGLPHHLAQYRSALQDALGPQRALDVQLLPPPRQGGRRAERRGERSHADLSADDAAADADERNERDDQAASRSAGMGMGANERGLRGGRPAPLFVAQVQLQGGDWLRIDSRPPLDNTPPPLRLLASLAVLLLAVLLLSAWAVRRVTRPLRDLAQAADQLGQNLHRPPLPDTGPEEVRRANRAFNTMQTRLAGMLEERLRTLAAMSHDLKTPLTRMRLRAELLDDDELRQRFEHDLDEMTQMVSDTLEFMRGGELPTERRPVDVMALLESLQADQEAMGRHVSLSGQALRPWLGDAARLRRCIGNLVDNAVLYGQRASLSVDDDATHLRIRVRDAGPGIPADALEQVFEPFVRLEASRNRVTGGTGLGLGIARNIARAAGGDLTLRNHPDGGLEACVTLPR